MISKNQLGTAEGVRHLRRPLPPELVLLGDHLELGARRALGNRRTRRQLLLNALTSVALAVPLVASAVNTIHRPAAPPSVPPPYQQAYGRNGDDMPPRVLSREATPSGDALVETSTLRRALR
jgi:hypothetical protein